MSTIAERSLALHGQLQGKIEVISRKHIESPEDLSLLYTPGVAEPCLRIQADEEESFRLTRRANLVAVITDGTAVLGLGDIGPVAGDGGQVRPLQRTGGRGRLPHLRGHQRHR